MGMAEIKQLRQRTGAGEMTYSENTHKCWDFRSAEHHDGSILGENKNRRAFGTCRIVLLGMWLPPNQEFFAFRKKVKIFYFIFEKKLKFFTFPQKKSKIFLLFILEKVKNFNFFFLLEKKYFFTFFLGESKKCFTFFLGKVKKITFFQEKSKKK